MLIFKLRLLEDQLDILGSQMNCVAKASPLLQLKVLQNYNTGNNNNNNNKQWYALQSRAELAQIKQEEVEGIDREDNTDQVSNVVEMKLVTVNSKSLCSWKFIWFLSTPAPGDL